MGGVGKADSECASGLNVSGGLVAGAQAKHHFVGIVQAAPGSVHGVGSAVFIIGANNQHRQGIKPGLGSEIFTHSKHSLQDYDFRMESREPAPLHLLDYFCWSTGGTISAYRLSISGVLV